MTSPFIIAIIYLVAFLISAYVYWDKLEYDSVKQKISFKDGLPILSENIFDFWFNSAIISLIIARLGYILFNIGQYLDIEWSTIPWDRTQDQIYFFEKWPWLFFNFSKGVDLSIFLIAFIVIFLLIVVIRGVSIKRFFEPLIFGFWSMCLSLVVIAFFIPTKGLSILTIQSVNFLGFINTNPYIFIVLVLSLVFFAYNVYWLRNPKRSISSSSNIVLFDLLTLSVTLGLIVLIIKANQGYEYNGLYLAFVPVLLGLILYLFGGLTKDGTDVKSSGQAMSIGKISFIVKDKKSKK